MGAIRVAAPKLRNGAKWSSGRAPRHVGACLPLPRDACSYARYPPALCVGSVQQIRSNFGANRLLGPPRNGTKSSTARGAASWSVFLWVHTCFPMCEARVSALSRLRYSLCNIDGLGHWCRSITVCGATQGTAPITYTDEAPPI